MALLDDILAKLTAMSPAEYKKVEREVMAATGHMCWIPNPGPHSYAFISPADELFYGGSAGGGKSSLGLGLALTSHTDSLILRRFNKDARQLADEVGNLIGTTDGRNSQLQQWRYKGRTLDFGGCPNEDDKQRFKGLPHDLIVFDEIPDFLKSQFTFIKIWNRTTKPGQRCRVVCTGNPPTTPEGLWVIEYWAAWLDPRHPNPAKEGELRWYVTTKHGEDREVDGPGPHRLEYDDSSFEEIRAKSRTFIRARLADNPFLMKTDYAANLDAMPAELRAAYRDGRFDLALEDNPRQVIPTSWVLAAQDRWRKNPRPPDGVPMCAVGVDPAAGGKDETVMAPRYDGWFAPVIAVPGAKTPMGSDVAALVISKRRDQAIIVVDMGGGYGGGVAQTLQENEIEFVAHKGAETATGRTRDGKLGFVNKRSQTYWRFREALDPDQTGGSPIMLPDDPRLMADLTAPTFSVGPRGIAVEPKEDIVERLGRSPDRGDATVMSWSSGATMASHGSQWRQGNVVGMAGRRVGNLQAVAKMGYDSRRRR